MDSYQNASQFWESDPIGSCNKAEAIVKSNANK